MEFQSISQMVKNDMFLPSYAVTGQFFGYDSKELFKKNLKKMPSDWYYTDHNVNYTVNRFGYRTQEFDKINWDKSVVLFGCSIVFGVGVDDEHTISSFLSKLLGVNVINMGIEGSAIDHSLINAVILKNKFPTPLGVVNLWTSADRTTYFYRNNIEHYGPWNIKTYYEEWSKDKWHAELQAIVSKKISDIMWKNIPNYNATFFSETSNLFDCDFLISIDKARDLRHPGFKTTKQVAEIIANKINL